MRCKQLRFPSGLRLNVGQKYLLILLGLGHVVMGKLESW